MQRHGDLQPLDFGVRPDAECLGCLGRGKGQALDDRGAGREAQIEGTADFGDKSGHCQVEPPARRAAL